MTANVCFRQNCMNIYPKHIVAALAARSEVTEGPAPLMKFNPNQ